MRDLTMASNVAVCLVMLSTAGFAFPSRAAKPANVLTRQDVLTIQNGSFYFRGKPYAEISFNKFDLFWEIYSLLDAGKGNTPEYNAMVKSEDRALSELHSLGFHSIRIFAAPWANWEFRIVYDDPIKRQEVFYKAMDTTLDLCDKNQIKVVYSLGAADFTDTKLVGSVWVGGEEQKRELMRDPNSRSRQDLYEYIDDVVTRYKSRKTILMWEVSNETTLTADISPDQNNVYQGLRMPSLLDVSQFLTDVAARIKADDPLHLVNSGGSSLRASQWNQYTKHNWQTDTVQQQDQALSLLYGDSAVDILDIHYYTDNTSTNSMVRGPDGSLKSMGIEQYSEEAKALGKPLMVGEAGISVAANDSNPSNERIYRQTPDFIDSYGSPNAVKWVKPLCDEIVAAKPQLVYFWEYSSDRPGDENPPSFNFKKGTTDSAIAVIAEANKRLKAELGAN